MRLLNYGTDHCLQINKEALDMLKMTKIAITGSLASGKSTVAKLMSRQRYNTHFLMQISQ